MWNVVFVLFQNEKSGSNDHLVIIIVVFSLILGAMTTAFLVNCIRKLVRDQKIIRVSKAYTHLYYFHRMSGIINTDFLLLIVLKERLNKNVF